MSRPGRTLVCTGDPFEVARHISAVSIADQFWPVTGADGAELRVES